MIIEIPEELKVKCKASLYFLDGHYLLRYTENGRQIVSMRPELISKPLLEIRCAGLGFGWHDASGNEWRQTEIGTWRQHTRVILL